MLIHDVNGNFESDDCNSFLAVLDLNITTKALSDVVAARESEAATKISYVRDVALLLQFREGLEKKVDLVLRYADTRVNHLSLENVGVARNRLLEIQQGLLTRVARLENILLSSFSRCQAEFDKDLALEMVVLD